MKLRNILLTFLIALITLLGVNVSAAATAPKNYTVRFQDLHRLSGANYFSGMNFHFYYKVNKDGKVIYCMQRTSDVVDSSEVYTLSKELGPEYAYVMENGYPNKSLTGNNDEDYYITGLAIWFLINPNDTIFEHFDFTNNTYRGKYSKNVEIINKLVVGAASHKYANPEVKLNLSNNKLSLDSSKEYYISDAITITAANIKGNYNLKLNNAPKGTLLVDKNGNEYKSGNVVYVKVPVKSINSMNIDFSLEVSASGVINKAYLYVPTHSRYQTTAALYPENKNVSDSLKLNITKVSKVEISKVDATTGNELPGAKLTVKDANGNIIDSWTSTNEVHVIEGLKPGVYTLTEEMAPEGYKLSTETITFTVNTDGTVDKKVVMYNAPKKTILISKRDFTTKEELPGAKLELRNEKGDLVEAWVSTNEPHAIEGLEPGKYTLTEVLAPEGYELSKETVTFTVKDDGTVDGDIIMYNKPETVEVPSTGSFKTITTSIIGILIIGLGSALIYRNYKKNNEEI